MTIDEAIEQLNELKCGECPTLFCENCVREKGKLIAEWLEELKAIKSDGFTDDLLNMGYTKGKKDGYNQALEDFEKCAIQQSGYMETEEGWYGMVVDTKDIKRIKEQLMK